MTKLIINLVIAVLIIAGEIKCIIKAWNCNWETIGKAEIIYTVSACCGLGAIVGWIDIKDN